MHADAGDQGGSPAIMGIEVGDPRRAVQYFRRAAFVDLVDNQGNTQEGIHIASAGGTWQMMVCGFGGFRVRNGQIRTSSPRRDRTRDGE